MFKKKTCVRVQPEDREKDREQQRDRTEEEPVETQPRNEKYTLEIRVGKTIF